MCLYRLRFVLGDIRSLFRLVVLKCVFTFKSNSLCKCEKKRYQVVFSGVDRTRRGLVGLKHTSKYIFNGLEKYGCVGAP